MAKTNYNEIKVAAARTALFNNIKDVVEEINIHDVLKLSSGENLPTHKMIDGNYPVFGGGGETGLTHNIFNVDFETLAIGRVGARCGCVFKVPKQSWVTDNALYALSFDKRFLLDFLIHYLNYVDLNQYANRAAQPVISLKRISSINFPLIDEAKQKAFIEIIEQVGNGETNFGDEYSELNNALKSVDRINELQDELSYQLTQLENLNQAILQEAVQGNLVKQDPKDEPASELLKRIKAEKAKSGKKEKPLPPIKPEEIPFDIPENWVWCRLGEIGEPTIGIIFKPRQVGKVGIPVLRANNVQNNKIDYSNLILVDTVVREKQIAKIGDILICVRSGSNNLIGKSAIIEKDGMSFGAFMSLYRSKFNDYVYHYMTSRLFKKQIDDKKSTGINQLTQGTLNGIIIPFPPQPEQKRIVVEIEKQLTKTKQLKEHIIANQHATEQLLKALLHQAFESAADR